MAGVVQTKNQILLEVRLADLVKCEKELEDLSTCGVCYFVYSKAIIPHRIPGCGHTYCGGCLAKIQACPSCRRVKGTPEVNRDVRDGMEKVSKKAAEIRDEVNRLKQAVAEEEEEAAAAVAAAKAAVEEAVRLGRHSVSIGGAGGGAGSGPSPAKKFIFPRAPGMGPSVPSRKGATIEDQLAKAKQNFIFDPSKTLNLALIAQTFGALSDGCDQLAALGGEDKEIAKSQAAEYARKKEKAIQIRIDIEPWQVYIDKPRDAAQLGEAYRAHVSNYSKLADLIGVDNREQRDYLYAQAQKFEQHADAIVKQAAKVEADAAARLAQIEATSVAIDHQTEQATLDVIAKEPELMRAAIQRIKEETLQACDAIAKRGEAEKARLASAASAAKARHEQQMKALLSQKPE